MGEEVPGAYGDALPACSFAHRRCDLGSLSSSADCALSDTAPHGIPCRVGLWSLRQSVVALRHCMRIAGCEGSSVWNKANKQTNKQTNKPPANPFTRSFGCARGWAHDTPAAAGAFVAIASRRGSREKPRGSNAICTSACFVQCFDAFVCLFVCTFGMACLFVCLVVCLFVCLRTFNTASTIAGTNGSIAFGARFATPIIITSACDSLPVFAFPAPSFAFKCACSLLSQALMHNSSSGSNRPYSVA